jgi:putative FmdB family regulatory protein
VARLISAVTTTVLPFDMPIFEYRCQSCHHEFETLVLKGTTPACPACKAETLERMISVPAVKSESTHALAMKAAKKRDAKQASELNRAQREYELHHND